MRYIRSFAVLLGIPALMAMCSVTSTSFAADAPKDDTKKDAPKEDLKVIKPDEAKDYEGQEVAVEFDVASARELATGLCFLNSTSDFNDPKGFTAVISPKGLSKFKEDSKTEKPADYFKKKKVRVSGKVLLYQKDKDSPKKYEIKIDAPSQIQIVEEKEKKT